MIFRSSDVTVTLNGHRIEQMTSAADAVQGWVVVADSYRRVPVMPVRAIVAKYADLPESLEKRVFRRLYGDVKLEANGTPILRASVGGPTVVALGQINEYGR